MAFESRVVAADPSQYKTPLLAVLVPRGDLPASLAALDKATGALLWEATLPSSGNATPATYEVSGRQFLVIAAGGGKSPAGGPGGVYVAFALPD